MYDILYGRKYERDFDITEIAKRVRKDIKAAVKIGGLPKGLKASVRTSRYSGGRSLRVAITVAPGVTINNPERVEFDRDNPHSHTAIPILSTRAQVTVDTIEAIVAAYNYDGSDIQTDYFNVNFYGSVGWDHDLQAADKARVLAEINGEPAPDDKPLEFGPEAVVALLTKATYWTNWSANEVAQRLHAGVSKVKKVLDALADADKLFKTWSPRRSTVIYRLPKDTDNPEDNRTNREWADQKAVEAKEARASTKAARKLATQKYEAHRAQEDSKVRAAAADVAELLKGLRTRPELEFGAFELGGSSAEQSAWVGRLGQLVNQGVLEVVTGRTTHNGSNLYRLAQDKPTDTRAAGAQAAIEAAAVTQDKEASGKKLSVDTPHGVFTRITTRDDITHIGVARYGTTRDNGAPVAAGRLLGNDGNWYAAVWSSSAKGAKRGPSLCYGEEIAGPVEVYPVADCSECTIQAPTCANCKHDIQAVAGAGAQDKRESAPVQIKLFLVGGQHDQKTE